MSVFTYTGIDCFGPLFVNFSRKTRSNQAISKRPGAIFTSWASYALHIKLAGDLSTENFILALCRFTDRRGSPQTVTSDNGANFVGAQQDLSDAIQKIGGCIEAMVKVTKRAFKTIVKNRLFMEEALLTFHTEVKSIINSRPITPASDDIDDFEPITPNHLLLNRSSPRTICHQSWGH